MANQFTVDDYYDVVELAESNPEARGTTVYWFSHPTTYGLGEIRVIVNNDEQAWVYSDISLELFGNPNEIDIYENYSHLHESTTHTRI